MAYKFTSPNGFMIQCDTIEEYNYLKANGGMKLLEGSVNETNGHADTQATKDDEVLHVYDVKDEKTTSKPQNGATFKVETKEELLSRVRPKLTKADWYLLRYIARNGNHVSRASLPVKHCYSSSAMEYSMYKLEKLEILKSFEEKSKFKTFTLVFPIKDILPQNEN